MGTIQDLIYIPGFASASAAASQEYGLVHGSKRRTDQFRVQPRTYFPY